MPLTAYSLCPGGTGKKIRFCCKELLPELEKLDRMMEGNQHASCVQRVDQLLQQPANRDRQCLLAIKGLLLRWDDKLSAALEHARYFVERYPGNALAHAELAIVTALTDAGRAAIPALQRAIEISDGQISMRVFEAMGGVADALLEDGDILAGRALLELRVNASRDNDAAFGALLEFFRNPGIPWPLKDDWLLPPVPDDAPWADEFRTAIAPINAGCWRIAAERVAGLVERYPGVPRFWRTLATLRGRLADDEGCVAALRRYAASEVPLEDAAEAELLALLLSEDPLGDALPLYELRWTVSDADRLNEALLSHPRLRLVQAEMRGADGPPPRGAYLLLDKPYVHSAEGLTLAQAPCWLGQVVLFGKQTDREAELIVGGVSAADLSAVRRFLEDLGGECLAPDLQQKETAKLSRSRQLFARRWAVPPDLAEEQLRALVAQHERQTLLEQWPQCKLGLLGDRTPAEAAADPACRARLLAAIACVELWMRPMGCQFDFNELRGQLGLPVFGPIDPQQTALGRLPLGRMSRLMCDKLSDEQLKHEFHRASVYAMRDAVRRLAGEIIARPTTKDDDAAATAYGALARTADRPQDALPHIEAGRNISEARGKSSAPWDLLELSCRFALGDGPGALRLIRHVEKDHIQEPGVAEALTRALIEVGVLRPDGTPAMPPAAAQAPAAPAAASPAPGEIWTPESQTPSGGKLWVPE